MTNNREPVLPSDQAENLPVQGSEREERRLALVERLVGDRDHEYHHDPIYRLQVETVVNVICDPANRDVVLRAMGLTEVEIETHTEGSAGLWEDVPFVEPMTYDPDWGEYRYGRGLSLWAFPEEEREAVYRKQTHPTDPPEAIERWLS